jgi:hypothetical protein
VVRFDKNGDMSVTARKLLNDNKRRRIIKETKEDIYLYSLSLGRYS